MIACLEINYYGSRDRGHGHGRDDHHRDDTCGVPDIQPSNLR
jgi:hypothetical protein